MTTDRRHPELLDLDALMAYLRHTSAGEELGEVRSVRQFRGGYSNLTYLLDGERGRAVLRRPPPGPRRGTAHDVLREYGILEGLAAVAGTASPAPRPLLACADEAVLGAPFYLMAYVEGPILRADVAADLSPAQRSRAARQLVGTLARLHATPLTGRLGEFGRPEGYVGRQVEGWARRFAEARTDDVSDGAALVEYLRAEQPADAPGSLLHGDFKFDNLVFVPDGEFDTVAAVLDWEMATVGHPLMDLGLTLAYWAHPEEAARIPLLGVNGTHLPGYPRREDVAEWYAAASGRELPDLTWYFAFGNFKLAGILQQLYARYRRGQTGDERFAPLGRVVDWLLARGLRR